MEEKPKYWRILYRPIPCFLEFCVCVVANWASEPLKKFLSPLVREWLPQMTYPQIIVGGLFLGIVSWPVLCGCEYLWRLWVWRKQKAVQNNDLTTIPGLQFIPERYNPYVYSNARFVSQQDDPSITTLIAKEVVKIEDEAKKESEREHSQCDECGKFFHQSELYSVELPRQEAKLFGVSAFIPEKPARIAKLCDYCYRKNQVIT